MLMEELFAGGVMTMGPSKNDPSRQVGVFRPEVISGLPSIRRAEMEKFRWIEGEWNFENHVPETRCSPAYVEIGSFQYAFTDSDTWISALTRDGRYHRQITFDPFSRRWIYVLTQGSYGILRSSEGWTGNGIVFSGLMTMIGIDCEWRMTWTKKNDNAFCFINEERESDGSWRFIDEWRLIRRTE